MANRFIDTGFYKSPFVRSLKGSLKSLYSFIICDCNGAGIWVKDLPIASVFIGFQITDKEFEDGFVLPKKAVDLKDGKFFFPDFIEHQYPKGLGANNPAHVNFIIELKKYKLIDENLKVKSKGLIRPLEGSNVIVKVMVKEEVKVIKEPEIEKKHWIQLFVSELGNVSKLKSQLTFEECELLELKHGEKQIKRVLLNMENKKDLLKKYVSVYLTCNNWLKLDFEKGQGKNTTIHEKKEFTLQK